MGKLIDRRPPAGVNGAEPDLTAEALALEVAEAEAEAEAAEARIAAAQARARAARLRRQASAAHVQAPDVTPAPGEDDAPSDDDVAVSSDPTPSRSWTDRIGRRSRRGTVLLALGTVVTCSALAVSGYLLWHDHDAATEKQRAAEFVAAARQGVVTLTTLDSSRAEADVQRVLDNSTGAFRDDFENRASDFTDVIQKSSVATEGQVNAAAVESMSEDSAVVLVAATSKVTNSAGAEQEPRAWRLSVTVTRDGGQLKMSKVEFVP